MPNVSEKPLPPNVAGALDGARQQAVQLLALGDQDDPKKVVEAIDRFVDEWQKGKRPSPKELDPQDAPYAFGSLWGQQLARQFGWEWVMIVFHDQKIPSRWELRSRIDR